MATERLHSPDRARGAFPGMNQRQPGVYRCTTRAVEKSAPDRELDAPAVSLFVC
jgi:hypothetical protein